ncbi:MAG: (Fe-S)-binding protein [Anaerolineales bacterium]|nr:(Fe-S)-binding protein [Anaerolineales bacterium]
MGGSLLTEVSERSGQPIELCYHCHKCTAGCPVAFVMEYGPDRILRLIQSGQMERLLVSRDLWLCLGCEMCGAHCPNEIDIAQVMITLREMARQSEVAAAMAGEDCQQLRQALAAYLLARPAVPVDDRLCAGVHRLDRLSGTIVAQHNISGDDNDARLIWSQNLERVPGSLERQAGVDLVYFVGCVASFFPRSYPVPQAMAALLEESRAAGGSTFTTLGGQEWCCGYPLLSMGRLAEARELIEHNVAQVKALGAGRVVFACPSCYHMWKFVYPDVLRGELGLDVLHAAELLDELIEGGALTPGRLDLQVTYHDPCDLGRKSQVFEPPRRLLRRIPGLRLVELGCSGEISECCGGGGNLESFDPETVPEISLRRVDRACEALAAVGGEGAQVLASACQQCERTLMAAARRHEGARRARLRVLDVAELVWQAVERGGALKGQAR